MEKIVKNRMVGAWKIGEKYFVRTVTMALTGKLIAVDEHELVLDNAAWIADTGRFADFLKTGQANEVEPFPDSVLVGRGAVIDACVFKHDLPNTQK